jgi:hypothetical protein
MAPIHHLRTRKDIEAEERRTFLEELDKLPPNAPIREQGLGFLTAQRDATATTQASPTAQTAPAPLPQNLSFVTAKPDATGAMSESERGQQGIEREKYQALRDKKGAEFAGRTYGDQKFLREGGQAIEDTITEISPVGDFGDWERAVADPSLMNVGVAGLSAIPFAGKGLKRAIKGFGIAKDASKVGKIPKHVQEAINKSRDRTIFDSAKFAEDKIATLTKEIDALDLAEKSSVRKRFELQDAQKALAKMKGESPPPRKLMPIEKKDLKKAKNLPSNAIDLTRYFDKKGNK